jgi:hypothetical protein
MVGCDFSRAVPEVVYVLDRDHFGLLARGAILAAGWAGMGDWLGKKRSADVDNCPFSYCP